jgi:hypothetical protein
MSTEYYKHVFIWFIQYFSVALFCGSAPLLKYPAMLMDNKESKIAFVSNEDIEERIQLVMRQTDYTQEVAREKLTAHNYDAIKCIKAYMGIAEKKAPAQVSLNQQIYRQLRTQLGSVALPEPTP